MNEIINQSINQSTINTILTVFGRWWTDERGLVQTSPRHAEIVRRAVVPKKRFYGTSHCPVYPVAIFGFGPERQTT